MSQIGRFADMFKVELTKVRSHIIAHEMAEGSAIEESIYGKCTGIETTYEIESPSDPALVAKVIRNARKACMIGNTVSVGVPIEDSFTLNGASFDTELYPKTEAPA
ncbi:MAG: hypothetical protein FI703_06940 [SAR202 cluster bacterium]|nr:hypothetical protein [SAR202 cluster bacterium]|tara:strand:- start:412 stop:729 length:318 start_codon:yes stop_codon:yes gene_type:complete